MDTNFTNKKILLGITGSIAAYKSPLIVRELVKAGAHVNVIMTPSAEQFVSKLVLSNLSRSPVVVRMFDEEMQSSGAWHIQLAHWADMMIIAPCSATTLSRIATGNCDTALSTLAIALPKEIPFLISPAMDSTMWQNPATQRNVDIVKNDGAVIIPPEEGELSSGITGPGRMPEIETLFDEIVKVFSEKSKQRYAESQTVHVRREEKAEADVEKIPAERIREAVEKPSKTLEEAVDEDKWNAEFDLEQLKNAGVKAETLTDFLKGKKVLVTAGPTYERIDDVRFIANHSSGKMGFALAEEARKAGANVTLITGPVNLKTIPGIKRIDIQTADEMAEMVLHEYPVADIMIMSAAVADFTPAQPKEGKIKKEDQKGNMTLELKRTRDILSELGQKKKEDQLLIGFALESENEIENGKKKLKDKNCDMIVANAANKERSGFGGDDNTITILTKDSEPESFPPMSKKDCARIILERASRV